MNKAKKQEPTISIIININGNINGNVSGNNLNAENIGNNNSSTKNPCKKRGISLVGLINKFRKVISKIIIILLSISNL